MSARFVLAPHTDDPVRMRLLRVIEQGIGAVRPDVALRRALRHEGDELLAGDHTVTLDDVRRISVFAFGKAAREMTLTAVECIGTFDLEGVVVGPDDAGIEGFECIRGAHPVPDAGSERGGRRLLERARECGRDDLALVLISGGGSALAVAPTAPLTLDDLAATNRALLRRGVTIHELNTVRKHLSDLKGGRLARALENAGRVVSLVLSDVVGSPLDMIASGPTVADPTTFDDAIGVIDRYELRDALPDRVIDHLEAGARGERDESPDRVRDDHVAHVIADGATAARAACGAAIESGLNARVESTTLEGEARDVARRLVDRGSGLAPGELLVFAGETTVTVTGDGTGGRNQELALAAAIELDGREDLVIASIGTDGIDGTTDSAGAFGDGHAVRRGRERGLDAEDHLRRNDSHTFLAAIGDTIDCGATGTNVGDLLLVFRPDASALHSTRRGP